MVTTGATELDTVRKALDAKGIEFVSAELEYVPNVTMEVDEETGRKIQKLVDALDVRNFPDKQ